MTNQIEVSWSGKAWALCSGEWSIKINGEDVNIPEKIKDRHFDTYGEYSEWFFDDDWSEYDEYYQDGLFMEAWVEKNMEWLGPELERLGVHFTPDDWGVLYDKVHEEDFRPGSCGGCV